MADTPLDVQALQAAGLSKAFAYMLINGDRQASPSTAFWLQDNHGITVPPLVGKSAAELELLRNMYPPKPPSAGRKAA